MLAQATLRGSLRFGRVEGFIITTATTVQRARKEFHPNLVGPALIASRSLDPFVVCFGGGGAMRFSGPD